MGTDYKEKLQLLPIEEIKLRFGRVVKYMQESGIDAILISDNANIFYLTGRVFRGYVYINTSGKVVYYVRRPNCLEDENVIYIRKPEDMADAIASESPESLGLEFAHTSYATVERLKKVFGNIVYVDASSVMRRCRAVKTPMQIEQMAMSGIKHTQVYRSIPSLYVEGMSDIEFQIEIERASRLQGCLGQFRVEGDDMEIYMGNLLTGDNSDSPSPYDFAMGGAGLHPSLPVGADGTIIKPGAPVMVDVNGNYTGYMTDMTRCFVAGNAPEIAIKANDLSRKICDTISAKARPGAAASDLYNIAVEIADQAGMSQYFMGHNYHAGFVGHGVGIVINESPVLAPRSRDILEAGNAIAVEPKFVIPGIGAVGIENTYIVEADGEARKLTLAPEEIVNLI